MRHPTFLLNLIFALLFMTSCSRHYMSSQGSDGSYAQMRYPQAGHGERITIDAGHGGNDSGAIGIGSTIQEKNLNLVTALMVRNYLQEMGYKVQMTRENDTFIPLLQRSEAANENQSQLFVSIHYNACPNPEVHGIEVHCYEAEASQEREQKSQELAQRVLGHIGARTCARLRGVKKSNLSVLRHTTMAAILVEGGFMSNVEELEKLKQPRYLNLIALGIAQGISEYVSQKRLLGDR